MLRELFDILETYWPVTICVFFLLLIIVIFYTVQINDGRKEKFILDTLKMGYVQKIENGHFVWIKEK